MTCPDSPPPVTAANGRRERKRQQQLDHLADTAWSLFEAEGYDGVTMERIAYAADVAKATLYKHFPAKEALLRHRFHRELRAAWPEIQARLSAVPPGRARLAVFMDRHAEWSERHRRYLLPYVRYRLAEAYLGGAASERSGLDRIYTGLIAEGQTVGDFRADLPAPLLASHLQFAHLATILRWLTGEGLSLPREIDGLLDLVCNGMGGRR